MVDEHKLITTLILVSLVFSVIGTITMFDTLLGDNGFERAMVFGISNFFPSTLTGGVGGTGDLNITQDITITLPDSSVNFGNGQVFPASSYAYLDSMGGRGNTGGTWPNLSDNITVRNDGNVGLNITISSNKLTGGGVGSFMCDYDIGGCGVGLGNLSSGLIFAFEGSQNEAGSCDNGLSGTQKFLVADEYQLCGCLKSASTEDEVAITFIVGIPSDAQGFKDSVLTLTAYESSVTC
ncbi:hypothetical protein CL619_03510 [archaeon]|nr:hypothetical protein [archaeon]|tara:strand:+ start:493 stop:1203 length:711 start_codon:yes stop_codon:yes gene_type:complete